MTTARVFKVENRLAAVARQPGGRTLAEAVAAAESRVEALRERCMAAMGPKTQRLQDLAVAGRAGVGEAAAGIYGVANEICALAGLFGQSALAEAAFSLCDLVVDANVDAAVNWPAVDVHVDAIRLLYAADGAAAADIIIAGLRKVSSRYTASRAGLERD